MTGAKNLLLAPEGRQRLIGPGELCFLSLVLVALLVVLFPSKQTLLQRGDRPDELALAYLRLLNQYEPGDAPLRLNLCEQLLSLGRLVEARAVLYPLLPEVQAQKSALRTAVPERVNQARLLSLRIDLAEAQARPRGDPGMRQALDRIGDQARSLSRQALSVAELKRLATQSVAINRNDVAAEIYQKLARAEHSYKRYWLGRAARAYLAAGKPGEAAKVYDQLAMDPDRDDDAKPAEEARRPRRSPLRRPTILHGHRGRRPAQRQVPTRGQRGPAGKQDPGDASRRESARLALEALIAANQGPQALDYATRYLERFPDDEDILRAALKLAQSLNATDLARRWGRQLLARHPQDAGEISRQLALELAAGDVKAALPLARDLAARRPGDEATLTQTAHVAEWAGQPDVALRQWALLAHRHPSGPALAEAIRLAPELREYDVLADMMALKARHGALSAVEVRTLSDAFETIGDPEQGCAILESYLTRFPRQREAWAALAKLQERRGELEASLKVWTDMAARLGGDVNEATERARLLWRLQRPREAFVVLSEAIKRAGLLDADEKTIREKLDLPARRDRDKGSADTGDTRDTGEEPDEDVEPDAMTLLGQLLATVESPEVLPLYRKLWHISVLSRGLVDHYISLARQVGKNAEAMEVAEEAYVRFRQPDLLLTAMDLADEGELHEDLVRLVRRAEADEGRFAQIKDYWLTKAEVCEQKGWHDKARAAYEHALRLDPESAVAHTGLLELLVDEVDRLADQPGPGSEAQARLHGYLRRWRSVTAREATLYLPLASAYSILGNAQEALRWYRKEWQRHPTDRRWLIDYAEALERAGLQLLARRMRLQALGFLQPTAIAAASRLERGDDASLAADRELLLTYVGLVRDTYGPGKGSHWLQQVVHVKNGSGASTSLLATWQRQKEAPRLQGVARPDPDADDEDEDVPGPRDRVKERVLLKEQQRVVVRYRQKANQGPGEQVPPSDAGRNESVDDERLPARHVSLSAGYQFEMLERLQVHSAVAQADLGWARMGLRLSAGFSYLGQLVDPFVTVDGNTLVPDPRTHIPPYLVEAEASVRYDVRYRRGHLFIGLGTSLRDQARLGLLSYVAPQDSVTVGTSLSGKGGPVLAPFHDGRRIDLTRLFDLGPGGDVVYASLVNEVRLWPGAMLNTTLKLNEVVDEAPALRLLGAKDSVSANLDVNLSPREFLRVEGDLQRYHLRGLPTGGVFGQGYSVELEAGHRLRLRNPEWDIHVSGLWSQNSRRDDFQVLSADTVPATSAPAIALAVLRPYTIDDFVASQFGEAGIGTSIAQGLPGTAPVGSYRLRYLADVWIGYLSPPANTFGFDVRAGLGISLKKGQELSVSGFVNNNQRLGQGLLWWGAGLRYVF